MRRGAPMMTAMLLTACFATGPVRASSGGSQGPAVSATVPLEAVAPIALKATTSDCPMPVPKGTLPDLFTPLPNPGAPVLSLRKVTGGPASLSHFSRDGDDVALSLLLSVIEGNTGFNVPFLKRLSGPVLAVPSGLQEPFLLAGTPAGHSYRLPWQGFWHQGRCEHLDGPVGALRAVGNGEVVGLRSRDGLPKDVVLRRADGTWWSLGDVPESVEPVPTTVDGRITLAWSRFEGVGLTAGAQFPDLGRTEVIRRYATFQPRQLHGGVAPWPAPWGPSRFSAPLLLDYDWEKSGDIVIDRPAFRGFERTQVATVRLARGCSSDHAVGDEAPGTTSRSAYTPQVLALGRERALVVWVEDEVRCRYERRKPTLDACPECPRDEGRETLSMKRTARTMELVVMGVDQRAHELARIRLPATLDEFSHGGIDLTTWQGRVVVFAAGYLLELDRAALEAEW